jgi:hypothetical protein
MHQVRFCCDKLRVWNKNVQAGKVKIRYHEILGCKNYVGIVWRTKMA